MTPGARVAAAIGILDTLLDGAPAERVLTTWARRNRYAGSGDRAAIRDHVFDALRQLASASALGGDAPGERTGRGVMLGLLRAQSHDLDTLFAGGKYDPAPLSDAERATPPQIDPLTALDCPEWLAPPLRAALGDSFGPVMQAMQVRAPLFLRVNLRKATLESAVSALSDEDIATRPGPLSDTALEVMENPRRVQISAAYRDGWVEVQDAASQAAVDALPAKDGQRVLDLCAGGGGKTLALAGRCDGQFFVHDTDPARMSDLPARAERAAVAVTALSTAELDEAEPFDLVIADVPCSGSGAWRRSPQGKWALTEQSLADFCTVQGQILRRAATLVNDQGALAYFTCSMLPAENADQIASFVADFPQWRVETCRSLTPLDGGDGFFLAILRRI
ncbi:RsmB/NOP family class I SAM-dependent RNA methyltransferase [Oceaniovalibus sp. ACAM 378]|uniref:RsmB/NOP family class I SAM-dependent RNA methyltransferase n=1 Tax=Oceaniovalibus sp. ACAM 378 TaxID=2599923 RepID=UPI0011D5678D|nr:RsmB/NOP family class I SAM-dependent RNA methyltransferase [Oceaniovalibus sp. ACAM 378]TYB91086.1 RsmB/NOP family class I SAM-dependent RNA methyltransferase [Oceaniovalibus sp. ACAM 378]